MKLFAIVSSLYFLALSCIPCADLHEFTKEKHCSSYSFAIPDSGHHDDGAENCSPLCACACCGQNIISIYYPGLLLVLVPVPNQDYTNYAYSFISEVYFNIWQPPRIS